MKCVVAAVLGLVSVAAGREATTSPPRSSPLEASGHAPSYHSATGTLASYDIEERVLVLRAAGAERPYHVAEDARVWLGNRRLAVSLLVTHVGAEVTLAYGEAEDGARTTHTIRLTEGSQR